MTALPALVAHELRRPAATDIAALAAHLREALGGEAVLFYGSALRTDSLDGVLDFYVLHADPAGSRPKWAFLWPRVSYHEHEINGRIVRAKVAAMPLATFEAAARGDTLDTTIWARFAQPARLLIAGTADVEQRVVAAVCDCVRTASRFAAALGPTSGDAEAYWLALFAHTYGAELRVEAQGRGRSILLSDPAYYRDALYHGWQDLGLIGTDPPEPLRPAISEAERRQWQARWRRRARAGKPLNILRLIRAAWTFDGAARYALWKIERHSGIAIALTPWRERHPILAAPGVLYHLWRAGGR